MDTRFRDEFKKWFAEAGIIYLMVAALVTLVFLVKGLQPLFSSSPTFSKKVVVAESPRYYGRTAQE